MTNGDGVTVDDWLPVAVEGLPVPELAGAPPVEHEVKRAAANAIDRRLESLMNCKRDGSAYCYEVP
jgi:hypothetical protein